MLELPLTGSGPLDDDEVQTRSDLDQAGAGEAVTLTLADEIDIARGDVLSHEAEAPHVADQFAAHLVWMVEEHLLAGRQYLMRIGTRFTMADQAAALTRLLRTQQRPVHLVGHSWGCLVASRVALDHPELVAELIEHKREAIETAKRAIASQSGVALLDFIRADIKETQRIAFDPQSLQVLVAAINATWWLNEKLEEWLGEKNVAGTAEYADGCAVATPTRAWQFGYPTPTRSVGVHFRPWGLAPFLPMPAAELCDRPATVEQIWGRPAIAELRHRLTLADTPHDMLMLLEEELVRRLRAINGLDIVRHLSSAIAETGGAVPISDLGVAARASSTYVAKRFKEVIGVTPKRLARSYRFTSTVLAINVAAPIDWGDVAAGAGYFDQAHFVREFREFTDASHPVIIE